MWLLEEKMKLKLSRRGFLKIGLAATAASGSITASEITSSQSPLVLSM